MTQEAVEVLTELWCLTAQESLGDYELEVTRSLITDNEYMVCVENKNFTEITLPFELIKDHYTPKEKAKIVISLLEQIVENGDQWLRDEENYHSDKLAEKGDNDYKSNLEND